MISCHGLKVFLDYALSSYEFNSVKQSKASPIWYYGGILNIIWKKLLKLFKITVAIRYHT